MKTVYPEIISLRYADIPKTTIEGQCSGIQLIIDMSLSDTAVEANCQLASAIKHNAPSQGGLHLLRAAPSSTQAVFKSGSTGIVNNAAETVSKSRRVEGVGEGSISGQDAQKPSEPVHMMAVKAEFERRLEKQVCNPTVP